MNARAPYHAEVAGGPDPRSLWVTAADGVRLRVVLWPGGARGTVLLFTGRTEYAEKYGRTAADLQALGLSTATLDWRGQGLSDRMLDDRLAGHVMEFADYQLDVAALVAEAQRAGLPEPYFLLAHSMGGCVGLRALYEGLEVRAAAFSAPMWGILMRPSLRPVAWSMSWAARLFGLGHRYAPGTGPAAYLEEAPFEGNLLTTDPEIYSDMRRQLAEVPDLTLGGPSLHWLYEALAETRALMARPAPDMPCVTFLGAQEQVVEPAAIHRRMADWPLGRLVLIEGAAHEVLMESVAIRTRVMDELRALFLGGEDRVAG